MISSAGYRPWARRSAQPEQGSSDMGLLVSAIGLSLLVSLFFLIQGCIKDTKNERLTERRLPVDLRRTRGFTPHIRREPGGYQARYSPGFGWHRVLKKQEDRAHQVKGEIIYREATAG